MLAESVKEWTEQWLREGREQGLEQGLERGREQGLERGLERGRAEERALLCRQAARKFDTETGRTAFGVAGTPRGPGAPRRGRRLDHRVRHRRGPAGAHGAPRLTGSRPLAPATRRLVRTGTFCPCTKARCGVFGSSSGSIAPRRTPSRARPDRAGRGPEPPSGETSRSRNQGESTLAGARPSQQQGRKPSTVHQTGVSPSERWWLDCRLRHGSDFAGLLSPIDYARTPAGLDG